MGPIEVKRIQLDDLSVPDISAVSYDNALSIPLIVAQESVDEEIESDGTSIAQCRPYSKIVGFRLQLFIRFTGADPITIRWMLEKQPDGEALHTGLDDTIFHSSNDTPTNREIRKNTLAKGIVLSNLSSGVSRLNVFVRRTTMKRLGALRENDRWRLLLTMNTSVTTQPKVFGIGQLYVRMN